MTTFRGISWLAIAIAIGTLFGPALCSDRTFAFRDAGHFYYPLFQWCSHEWAEGRVPLWNPYENTGMPTLADASSSVFYPGKLLFVLPIDFALGYKLYVVLHVLLAAAGSYGLARAWKASPAAAALAAIAYSCGGNVVFQYCNVVFLVGAAWLPLAALAAEYMLRERRGRFAAMLGAILAMMILGGDPEAAFHVLLMVALYSAVLAFSRGADGEADTVSANGGMHRLLARFGLTGLAAAIAFGLSAVQILPSSEAVQLSERAAFNRPRNIYEVAAILMQPDTHQLHGESRGQAILRGIIGETEARSHHEQTYDFSVGPWRLAEYLWPNLSGRMFPTHCRWLSLLPGEQRTWTPTLYVGLLPIVLALGCLRFRGGEPRARWLSLLVVLFTLGSFGYYGAGWLVTELFGALRAQNPTSLQIGAPVGGLYWLLVTMVPGYVYFRYPAKLLPFVSLGLSQLAAIGLDRVVARGIPRVPRGLLSLGGGSMVAALIVWFAGPQSFGTLAERCLLWCVGEARFATMRWNDAAMGPFDAAGAYGDVLCALVQTAVVALMSYWVLWRAWSDPHQSGRWKVIATLLTAAEIGVANAWLISSAPANIWRSESSLDATIRKSRLPDAATTPPRIYRGNVASWRPARFAVQRSTSRLAEMSLWERDSLFPKFQLNSELALVESYGSIRLADDESLLRVAKQHGPRQSDKSLLPQPTSLRLLGAEFLVLPEIHRPTFAERIVEYHLSRWGSDKRMVSAVPEGAALWRMERTLPRAWVVHEIEVLAPLPRPAQLEIIDERTREVLFPAGQARDFSQMAVIESKVLPAEQSSEAGGPSVSNASSEKCQILHYGPQRVILEAELERAGLVVLSDAWYPGWKATVLSAEGPREVPIYRTNRVCRGVWLPAGKQTVEFRFECPTFIRGAWISCLSWLAVAIAAISWLATRRMWRK